MAFKVLVDYSVLINDLVSSKDYDVISLPECFIRLPERLLEVEVETVCFNRLLELKDLPRDLNNIGFRLANIEEFLAFGKQCPEVQRQFPIVTYINGLLLRLSFCGVPDAWSSYGWRELVVDKPKDNLHSFHGSVRFLAVKK